MDDCVALINIVRSLVSDKVTFNVKGVVLVLVIDPIHQLISKVKVDDTNAAIVLDIVNLVLTDQCRRLSIVGIVLIDVGEGNIASLLFNQPRRCVIG